MSFGIRKRKGKLSVGGASFLNSDRFKKAKKIAKRFAINYPSAVLGEGNKIKFPKKRKLLMQRG